MMGWVRSNFLKHKVFIYNVEHFNILRRSEMSINVGLNSNSPSFKGNLVIVNKKGEKTLIQAK